MFIETVDGTYLDLNRVVKIVTDKHSGKGPVADEYIAIGIMESGDREFLRAFETDTELREWVCEIFETVEEPSHDPPVPDSMLSVTITEPEGDLSTKSTPIPIPIEPTTQTEVTGGSIEKSINPKSQKSK